MMKNRIEERGVRAGWVATKSGNLPSNKPDAVRVGWVERSDTQQRYATITPGDGYRCAPPILRVLGITEANTSGTNETVTLYSAAHVSNQP
jgi:hypothetical protein